MISYLHRPSAGFLINITVTGFMVMQITQPVLASTLIVPTSQYPTIQKALDATKNGDTVLVNPGTYPEIGLTFRGKAVWLKSVNGPKITIIDGKTKGIAFIFTQGETRSAVIEGFTITNGYGITGGGVFMRDSSPTIRGNIFNFNRSNKGGGAIQVYSSSANSLSNPLIKENTFFDNVAEIDGGAIHIQSSSAEIVRNKFYNNHADGDPASSHGAGGAILATQSTNVKIIENFFEKNLALFAGGAISAFATDISIVGNIIRDNDGGLFAGGIHLETQKSFGNRTFLVKNNRIERNTATDKGGGIHTYMEDTGSTIEIVRNMILDNAAVDPACTSTNLSCGLGGGIGHFGGVGIMIMKDNIIKGNRADLYGGGIFTGISLKFQGNEIKKNKAKRAYPGIVVNDANQVVIIKNKFISNSLETGFDSNDVNAGALKISRWKIGNTIIEGNLFQSNQGVVGSLVVNNSNLLAKIIGNTFVDNQTIASFGGSIWMQSQGDIINNILSGDQNGIRIFGQPLQLRLNYNNFINNSSGLVLYPPAIYKKVEDLNSTSYAENNLTKNPLFRNMLGDYHLFSLSGLIDQANCKEFISGLDFDGESRPLGAGCEIGADEYSIQSPVSIGLLNRNTATFYLRNSNSAGAADITFRYGAPNSGWLPLAGDWDGDGIDTPGFYRPDTATFYLRNSNSAGAADITFRYGAPNSGWLPLAGDWDGIR